MGRLWIKTIIKFFQKIGFVLINIDPCILAYRHVNVLIIVRVYVDDFMLASQSQNGMSWLKDQFMKEFNIKDLKKAKIIIG